MRLTVRCFYKQPEAEADLAAAERFTHPFSPAIAVFGGKGIQEQQKEKSTEVAFVDSPVSEWLQVKTSPLKNYAQSHACDSLAGQSTWLCFGRRGGFPANELLHASVHPVFHVGT